MTKTNRIRNSLRASFLDGIFASLMAGFTIDYLVPYALRLKATVTEVGLLFFIPNLTASLFQLKAADVTERLASRKKVVKVFVFLQALMLFPIAFLSIIFRTDQVLWLIVMVTLFSSLGAFTASSWASLMADYIPAKMRGRYFGWRNRILGFITVGASFVAAFLLNRFKQNPLYGFMLIFTAAGIFRFISWYYLTLMYEPKLKVKKENYFSLWDFLGSIREGNFARFVLFTSGFHFSVAVASRFFAVFMLRDLGFDYLTFITVALSPTITYLIFTSRWGLIADRVGNMRVIKLCSFFITAVPLFWLFSHNVFYLIAVQIFAGFCWSGFDLCASNFIYDAITPSKRTRYISYFNVLNGVALSLGALLGGFLAHYLPPLLGYRLLSLFLVSSILRFSVVFILHNRIHEVKKTEEISAKDLFYSVARINSVFSIFSKNFHGKKE